MCGVGGGVYVCVCVYASVYDVTQGAEQQSSGRPDSERLTVERERERQSAQ